VLKVSFKKKSCYRNKEYKEKNKIVHYTAGIKKRSRAPV